MDKGSPCIAMVGDVLFRILFINTSDALYSVCKMILWRWTSLLEWRYMVSEAILCTCIVVLWRLRSAGPKVDHHLSAFLHLWQDRNGNVPHLAHRVDKLAHSSLGSAVVTVYALMCRVVSGVVLLTRHTEAARRIAELFHERKIIKKYLWVSTW